MSNLTIINQSGQLLVESRQVAEMVGKQHDQLMRSIRTYIEYLTSAKMQTLEFFIENTYQDSKGETRPCYLITKQGCEMVGNKMTGEKGVLFTATYVTKFNEMEKQLSAPMQALSPQLQLLINLELKQQEQDKAIFEIASSVQGIRDVVALNPNDWRKDSSNLINKMAISMGGYEHVKPLRAESYKVLDERFGVDLQCRLTNKRRRMADEGVCKSKRDKLNQLDVIADDKKLIEGYIAIIKEMAIKYGLK
ncbi:Rha family transcriptional regulator [Pelosinus fermentans]|uniref:Phage regulatory protein, Rha family n=1 Tax=Pelosinus fermentans JBW45 TaxID=1192197 RepID=I8TQI6_9FIRM|nr:Rha family transcriptional regulator [Pelosinus fermentans]AJQ26882.1 phage regulatory protein, Rha family [Pelosinus fermentans JBW45]